MTIATALMVHPASVSLEAVDMPGCNATKAFLGVVKGLLNLDLH